MGAWRGGRELFPLSPAPCALSPDEPLSCTWSVSRPRIGGPAVSPKPHRARLHAAKADPHRCSSVAQRQSIRLLTGGLLVRIQPEEPTPKANQINHLQGCISRRFASRAPSITCGAGDRTGRFPQLGRIVTFGQRPGRSHRLSRAARRTHSSDRRTRQTQTRSPPTSGRSPRDEQLLLPLR